MARVVVTGLGAVAPNGIGVEQFWDNLCHGRDSIRHFRQHFTRHINRLNHFWQLAGVDACRLDD
ncbi:MAG: beta-ketoacyl-[acyl-carrier-protein] synthase II, partial [Anaerolineales bacterium]|nr:beta-ketoacyl-[acyl-carrier-protein] synthase II [Anaerolineales bacterium]